MIGLGKMIASGIIAANPTNHIHGAIAAIARPPSSGTTGSRLNRFRKKPVNASARHRSLPVACQTRTHAAAPMLPRIGPASPTRASAVRVVAQRASRDHGAQERDEHRRAGLDALAPQRDRVSHLVHEQQRDEARGERPAPQQRIRGERHQDRARRREQLQLRKQQQDRLELREHGDDRRADRRQPPADRALRAPLGHGVGTLRSGSNTGSGSGRGPSGAPTGANGHCSVRIHYYTIVGTAMGRSGAILTTSFG